MWPPECKRLLPGEFLDSFLKGTRPSVILLTSSLPHKMRPRAVAVWEESQRGLGA